MNDVEEYMFKKPYEIMTLQDVYIELIIAELQEDRKKWVNQYTQAHNDYVSLQQKTKQLQNNRNELKKWLEEEIYNIEPKGTVINYNCEYDSEEDYINAMKERSKLITLKRVLIMLQELEGKNE